MSRTTPIPVGLPIPAEKTQSAIAPWVECTKPRITRMVVVTAVIGLVLASASLGVPSWTDLAIALIAVVLGTTLSASGANCLNQWAERDRDARMDRTRLRPIPAGKLQPHTVLLFALTLSTLGSIILWAILGPVPALVALACILTYILIYTPLKVVTPWSTLVGAIPGALPPLIGWTALAGPDRASSVLDPAGLSLVAIMIVWQLPHFLAIAWMYRQDYAKGGFRVLPVLDPKGRITARVILLTSALLLLVSLTPAWAMPDHVSVAYLIVALLSGTAYLTLCTRLAQERSVARARVVFFASIIHLPLLLVALVSDALL